MMEENVLRKYIITKLNEGFIELLKKPEVTQDYCSYYSAIVNWIKQNKKYFNENILKNNKLDVLLKLDPKIYIIDNPEIILSMEAERVGKIKHDKVDTLAMIIGDNLWDMVTISSGKDCPICRYNELRYVIAQTEKERKLVLECKNCGWCEYMDGNKWSDGIAEWIPASKNDLEEFGIKIPSTK